MQRLWMKLITACALALVAAGPVLALAAHATPVIGASWAGVSDSGVSPPDPNGAIGPNSYVEIINTEIGIFDRTGAVIQSTDLHVLTGASPSTWLSDPMVLWDENTQRFYYNVWDTTHDTMDWGFSKNANPRHVPGGFCSYTASFGYSPPEQPDYPKLGQTTGFLMIGVNHYPNGSAKHADRSDLLWISKPQGHAALTTCPAASAFNSGKFTDLRNQDGTQAFTPVPAIQDDPGSLGWIVTESDIECPDICGSGTQITVHRLAPNPSNPSVPILTVTGHSITVPSFSPPLSAPQEGSTYTIDTLDGRLEHAVSAVDPRINKVVVWTGHTVNGSGNRSEFRWYEILPTPYTAPTLVHSGVVSSPTLFVYNGSVAPDRTVNPSGAAHGDSFVIGFSASSASTYAADQMVSQIGNGSPSGFVLVHQSASADTDFTCSNTAPCRWGDYGGATSDPAQSLTAAHGQVWLSNEAVTQGANTTWNWEASP